MHTPIQTDCVIIGAGPVGLFQVFELGLLGLKAHVIDTLDEVGGQCIKLYPDKPIYDIPALPVCTGRELTERLVEQGRPFDPVFHLSQQVTEVTKRDDRRFTVVTSAGTTFDAGCVIIAAGVGAFSPKRIALRGIDAYEGTNLHYHVSDPTVFHDKELVILGGGDSALDWALELSKHSAVLLVHRRDMFRAATHSVEAMRAKCEALEMQFMVGTLSDTIEVDGVLQGVEVKGADQVKRAITFDHLLCFYGLSPRLGPIADWGLDIRKKKIEVNTETFQTNVDGIYAVGDINLYAGKKKLILSGFHEAALAAFGAKAYLFPEERVFLEYTTTSPKLHERLGVDDPFREEFEKGTL